MTTELALTEEPLQESQGGYGRYGVRGGLTARERSRLQAGQLGRSRKVAA